MSGISRKFMAERYIEDAQPTGHFTGMFRSGPNSYFDTETVELDVVRENELVAIAIQDMSVGYRHNSANIFTNKEFEPPVFGESFAVNSFDLLKRSAGQNPFGNPNFLANLIDRVFMQARLVEAKIRRAIEVQASQVMQTGTVTLIDINGATMYTIDYKPKSTHFPTAGTDWDASGATPLEDLESLANVIRQDGKYNPDQLHFGDDAFDLFIKNDDVKARLDNRRMDLGRVTMPETVGNGATFRGTVAIGAYRFDMFTYGSTYLHPQTSAVTRYLTTDNVVMVASAGRKDARFGSIPNIGELLGKSNGSAIPELPRRIKNAAGRVDLHFSSWLTEDGRSLFAGVGARPIMIPVAIDTFGCLNTIA